MRNLPRKARCTRKYPRSKSRADFIYCDILDVLQKYPIVTNFRQDQSLHKFQYRFLL